jgi:hypothetical protein
MKTSFLILLLSAICITVSAQKNRRNTSVRSTAASGFSIGLEAGIPVGENGKPYSSVIGGSLQYEIMPDKDLGITLSAGYLRYTFKSSYGGGGAGFVPLLAGVKYYFTPAVFFHAQLGAAAGTKNGQGTSFAYSPGAGFKFTSDIDAELKYMGISNSGGSLNDVGIRIAYNF